jgi:DNA primase
MPPKIKNLDAVIVANPHAGVTLTKQDVLDYYDTPEVKRKLLREIRNKDLISVMPRDGKKIIRRYRRAGEPIKIRNEGDLDWYTQRRYSEFHPTVGKKTNQVWVDLDAGEQVDIDQVKPAVHAVLKEFRKMPGMKKTDVAFSGGSGFYVKGKLKAPKDTAVLQRTLKRLMGKLSRRKNNYTTSPPGEGQVRLDVSTFHDQGSIRAPYSLNTDTGLVSVPVREQDVKRFNPDTDASPLVVITNLRKKRQGKQFAPGIPKSKKVEELPKFKKPKSWILAVQEHKARRAGKHYDLRLVDPWTGHAHSWALPKSKLPKKGERPVLAVQTPTHTSDYALGFGAGATQEITKGYGKGTVRIKYKEPVQILQSAPSKVKFKRRMIDTEDQDYVLFRAKDQSWLLKNTTQEKQGEHMRSIYWKGFDNILEKLGAPQKVKSMIRQKSLSTSESEMPINNNDNGMPAHGLAGLLGQIRVPERTQHGDNASDNVENRLNRPTVWGPREEISNDIATGPSPISMRS